jgi:hemolysin activation/secretion protein
LLSDVPGAVVNSTLTPGADVGTSDLEVSASPGAPYGGSAALDNAGNRYTGRGRVSGALDIDNPLHHGDVLSVNGLTAGSGLTYGRIDYQTLLNNGAGTSVGGSVSGLYYALGNGLSDLDAHGTAQVESLTLQQPLIRSTAGNLFGQFALNNKQLRDEIDASDIHTDRRTDSATLTLAGDRRDAGGITNFNLGLTFGRLEFENEAAASADSAGARIRGDYGKFTMSVARLQGLSASNSVYLAFNGQISDKNLDSSEQFFLGGPNSVRAYDVGVLGGALGGLASAEFRHNLSVQAAGTWQAIMFIDSGVVRIYKNVFEAGPNHANLSGAGAGLNWVGRNGWTVSGTLAAPIGGVSALAGDSASSRLWLQMGKAFSAAPTHR